MKTKFRKALLYTSGNLCFLLILVFAASAQRFTRDIGFNGNRPTTANLSRCIKVIPNSVTDYAGKIMVAGWFNYYDNVVWPKIYPSLVRLEKDGTLDPSFQVTQIPSYSTIKFETIDIFPDGSVIVGGDFDITVTNPDNVNVTFTNLIKLDQTGKIDFSFNRTGGGTYNVSSTGIVRSVLIVNAPDGTPKIWVGGDFRSYKGTLIVTSNGIGTRKGGLVVLNMDGSIYANPLLEDAYSTTAGVSGSTGGGVWSLVPTSDGKVLVGGDFGHYGGEPNGKFVRRVARMLNDGTLDPSFLQVSNTDLILGPGGGVFSVAEQILPDGEKKIIIVGAFTSFRDNVGSNPAAQYNTGVTGIAQLNLDGSLNTSFRANVGAGFNVSGVTDAPQKVLPDARGRLLVGGRITTYNGAARNWLFRITADGMFDNSFEIGTGFAGSNSSMSVYDLAFQPYTTGSVLDTAILVAGYFDSFEDNSIQPHTIRLRNGVIALSTSISNFLVKKEGGNKVRISWKGEPDKYSYALEKSLDGRNFSTIAVFNSPTSNNIYLYDDQLSENQRIYYRVAIKQVSGAANVQKVTYSQVLSIFNAGTFIADIYRPSVSLLKIRIAASSPVRETLQVTIISMAGQMLYTETLKIESVRLERVINITPNMRNSFVIITRKDEGVPLQQVFLQ